MKIVLVDDHQMFREALAERLGAEGWSVVAEVGDARAGAAAVLQHRPDVVVMDLVLPGSNGIVATRELLREDFRPPVLMLTATDEPALVLEALRAGVVGYALKTQTVADLLTALEQTAERRRYLPPSLKTRLDLMSKEASAGPPGLTSALSPRELEVFDLVVAGHSSAAIGRSLFISVKTVETHRTRINRKLGVHSTAEMIRLAARCGRLLS